MEAPNTTYLPLSLGAGHRTTSRLGYDLRIRTLRLLGPSLVKPLDFAIIKNSRHTQRLDFANATVVLWLQLVSKTSARYLILVSYLKTFTSLPILIMSGHPACHFSRSLPHPCQGFSLLEIHLSPPVRTFFCLPAVADQLSTG